MNTKQNICIVNEGNIYFQTHTSIKVNGGYIWSQRIYTKQTKDLVPIVFLHGGPGGEHVKWKWAMKDLCVQFPLIFYDQIGGGFSKQLDKHINRENLWTIQNFVLQLDTLIKYYNLTDFILAGTSWGSTLALQYYLHKPKTQPLGLILNSPLISTKIWVEDAQKLKKQLPKALYEALQECEQKNDTKSQKYYEIQSYYYKTHIIRSEMLTNQHQKVLKATQGMFNAEAYIYMWGRNQFFPTGTLVGYDRVPHLGDVGVPVLFTCGEFDEATPDSVYGFHQKVPGSEYFMFEGCSHCPYFEDPKKYQLILSQFYWKVVKK